MWEPVLEGSLAESARRLARDIAHDVATAEHVSPVDRLLLFAYASASIDEPFVIAAYDAALEEVVARCSTVRDPSLFNDGLAGIGWSLAHVLDAEDASILAPVDDALVGVVSRTPWQGDYELSQGLVGHGMYFLERLRGGDVPRARDGLVKIVEQLGALAERGDDGACWFTRAELGSSHQRKAWPEGRYDCGLAHGIPGAIAMLARAAAFVPEARVLGDDALRWFLAKEQPPGPRGGRFPGAITAGAPVQVMPVPGWCYGDLGVAMALWHAGQHDLARATMLACSAPVLRDRVVDAGLCHGTAGLAHACQRFYVATGDDAFREAARAWFEITLEADSIATLHGASDWATYGNTRKLANGAIGVALALLGAANPTEPSWDRWMLCDVTAANDRTIAAG